MENLEPPSSQIKDGKMARFCPSRGFILDLGGGGGGLLFHFILSKIVGDVTRFGGVIRLSIKSLILIWSRLHDRWGNPPHITSPTWGPPPPWKQALREKYQEKNLKTGYLLSCGKKITRLTWKRFSCRPQNRIVSVESMRPVDRDQWAVSCLF